MYEPILLKGNIINVVYLLHKEKRIDEIYLLNICFKSGYWISDTPPQQRYIIDISEQEEMGVVVNPENDIWNWIASLPVDEYTLIGCMLFNVMVVFAVSNVVYLIGGIDPFSGFLYDDDTISDTIISAKNLFINCEYLSTDDLDDVIKYIPYNTPLQGFYYQEMALSLITNISRYNHKPVFRCFEDIIFV